MVTADESLHLFELVVVVLVLRVVLVRVPAPQLEHALGDLLHLVVVHAPRAQRRARPPPRAPRAPARRARLDNARANAGVDARRAVAAAKRGGGRPANASGNVSGRGRGASETNRSRGARYRSRRSAASSDARDEAALARSNDVPEDDGV